MGFSDDFLLEINESISIRMKFAIESGNCGNDCTDLTLTLSRGQEQLSQFVLPANSVNNETISQANGIFWSTTQFVLGTGTQC